LNLIVRSDGIMTCISRILTRISRQVSIRSTH
jgi:hypothetical protein